MQDYKKILVPIALDDNDADAIAWANYLSKSIKAEEILFVHPYEDTPVPDELHDSLPTDQDLLEEIKTLVSHHATTSEKFSYKVVGRKSTFVALMEAVEHQHSDLIIIGKESFASNMPVRIARHSPCSLMSIPVGSKPQVEKIMVTTDFSDFAREALELGLQIASSKNIQEIDSVHVFNLGRGSKKVVVPESTQKELAAQYIEQLHNDYLQEFETHDIAIRPHNYYDRYVYEALESAASELQSDLVVISCRGKGAITSWFLGSVTENLLTEASVPVIAARTKDKKSGFLNLIKGN